MQVSPPHQVRGLRAPLNPASFGGLVEAAPTRPAAQLFHLVASQTVLAFAFTCAALVLGFATKMLLARAMPAADLGIVLAAHAFTSLALVVAELGVPDAVVRQVGAEASSQSAPRRTVQTALGIVATSAILTSGAVTAALFFWLGAAMSEDALWATVVLTCGLPLLAAGDVLGSAHRGVNRLGTKLLLIDVARPGIVALAVILSPLAFVRRAPYIAGLYVLAALLVLAGLWLLFQRDRRWRDTGAATSSELLRFGVPVAGAAILAGPLVNGLLPTMLSASAGSAAVALYGVALALQGVVALPVGIFEQVLVPVWARMATDGSHDDLARSYQQYTRICFALAAGLGIVLIANADPMLSFAFGGAYAAAAPALEWAVAATLFAAWTGPNEAMLRALGLARPIFVARLVTAAAGTIAAGALIPQYGLLGAIAAFALAVVVLNVSYASTLYRERRIHPFTPWQTATTLGVVGAILAATAAGRHSQGGWIVAHVAALVVVVANIDLRSTLAVVRETARTFR